MHITRGVAPGFDEAALLALRRAEMRPNPSTRIPHPSAQSPPSSASIYWTKATKGIAKTCRDAAKRKACHPICAFFATIPLQRRLNLVETTKKSASFPRHPLIASASYSLPGLVGSPVRTFVFPSLIS